MRTRVLTTWLWLWPFTFAATSASGQTLSPRWQPTVGVGLGWSDDGNYSGDGRHLLLTAACEVPLGGGTRIRVDGGRTHQPVPSGASRGMPPDVARISRATVSVAAVKAGLSPLSPYGGLGIGVYRVSFDRAPTTSWRRGGYLYGGIEVQAGDAIAIDGEVGLHVIPQTLYPEGALLGEIVVRTRIRM